MPSPNRQRFCRSASPLLSLGPLARTAVAQLVAGAALASYTAPSSLSGLAVALGATIGCLGLPLARLATLLVCDNPRVHHVAGRVWAASVPLFFAMTIADAYDGTGAAFAEKVATPFPLSVMLGLCFCIGAQGALLSVPTDLIVNVSVSILAMTAIKLRVECTLAYVALHAASLGGMTIGFGCVRRFADLRETEREAAEAVVHTAVLTRQPYVVTDRHLTILAVNERFSDVLGYAADEVYGKNVSFVLETSVDAHWMHLAIAGGQREHVWSVVTRAGPTLPVRITFGETRCPVNGTEFYYAKFASMALEQRNAQLVAEKERLAWDLASCAGACDSCTGRVSANVVNVDVSGGEGIPRATSHRTLGAMQDPAVTRRAVSCARSYDHVDSRDASPVASGPVVRIVAPSAPARSDASTVDTLASSVMDTVSVAAAKDVTRAPPPPKKVCLRRPTKTSSDPGSSKPNPNQANPNQEVRRARPLPVVECNLRTDDLRECS